MEDDKKGGIAADAKQVKEAVVAEAEHVETVALTTAHKVERAVQRWLADHLHNTAFSQDTASWNVLQKALPHLAPMITEEVG